MDRRGPRRGSSADRISNLPGNVTDQILSFLPLRYAVRTSVLSRQWKHKWLTIPCLEFFQISESVVYQVLLLHRGHIVKFSFESHDVVSRCAIYQWLHFLSNHDVEDLTLKLDYSLQLPQHLFNFQHLKHLHLYNCHVVPPPTFIGFSKLVKLVLKDVLIEAGELHELISKCTVLEFFNITSYSGNENYVLELDFPPSLKCFKFHGEAESLSISGSGVEDLSIHFTQDESSSESDTLTTFFSQLPTIKVLEVNDLFMEYLLGYSIPRRLPKHLVHLKLIQFSGRWLEDRDIVAGAFCLIRSSPNLQSVVFSMGEEAQNVVQYLEDQQKSQRRLSYSVKNVTIDHFSCTPLQMAFVKYLLFSLVKLRELKIKMEEQFDYYDELEATRDLAGFRRSSPEAVIVFIDP